QWEFAARGGNQSRNYRYSGRNTLNVVAWHGGIGGENSGSRTHPVGTRAPNELGLYDMSGNVWEWVWDRYGPYPSVPETDPDGASSGSYRAIRGGSWNNFGWFLRPVLRPRGCPGDHFNTLGFRLVRPASPGF
ncbi:MAG: formylglycine-generating enzyme family protein, partial [Treponema sp.]|nr:formylglycine-generating enzyme family protein [Treponema sp.]